MCKKRLAELHDDELFTQNDSSQLGECPLCCLPLSIDARKSSMMSCCCKVICNGCNYANQKREFEQGLEPRCAFCREPSPKSDEEHNKNVMERIKKNDPVAMTQMGKIHEKEGDFGKALEYWAKAAELGDADAHCGLGMLYYNGTGVEKDEKKFVYHFEQAAIGGHTSARGLLAAHEIENGRSERAVKHCIINANLGCDESLKYIKMLFVQGVASKEEYAAALRGYQAAVNETKSAERDKAEEAKIHSNFTLLL
jgi:tetratricopeptide (TPR) repeat protein